MTDDDPYFTPLVDKLADELDAVQNEASEIQELVEPSDEEKRNGWDAISLTKYLTERLAGQSLAIDTNSLQRRLARRPVEANHKYRVHRWRG